MLHHSITHTHGKAIDGGPESSSSHKHDDFREVHHDHHFHVGIFHFFGHLFENINHSNELADKYLIIVQKTETKKVVDYNLPIQVYFDPNGNIVIDVDAESLPDPPYHLPLLQKLKLPSTPHRGPPSLV